MNKIFLYPTDTLYGLGVDATNADAVGDLFVLKGRDDGKPVSIMVSDVPMMEEYVTMTPLARILTEHFLPGKLTLVLEAKNLPHNLTAGTNTVGVRIPDAAIAMNVVKHIGAPVTATSANVSGQPPCYSVQDILKQFGEKADHITVFPGTPQHLPPSEPSTVVDAQGSTPLVLREGAILEQEIKERIS